MVINQKIKALVVDDSLLMREMVSDILSSDADIEVIGTAHDGKAALEKVRALKPDVITADIEMPVMDGIEFLSHLMQENPTPVVVVSSITYEGGFKTLQALEKGAFDYVQKPKAQYSSSLLEINQDIITKVKKAASSNYIKKLITKKQPPLRPGETPLKLKKLKNNPKAIIAIGISTGGPPCLTKIFEALPSSCPPLLVVQHMPDPYTKAMAERINKTSAMTVKEAKEGDFLSKGHGYIAPGHSHMRIKNGSQGFQIKLSDEGLISGHRPSVDALFESVADQCQSHAIGIIMTGMGRDGATMLKQMHNQGAYTMAQNEESCAVFGMPKMAINENAVDDVLSLDQIINQLKNLVS